MSHGDLTSCISLTLLFFIGLIIVHDFIDRWVDEYYDYLRDKGDLYKQYESVTTEYRVIGITRDFGPVLNLRYQNFVCHKILRRPVND